MSLEHIWAGWRSSYVASVVTPPRPGEQGTAGGGVGDAPCVFCRIIAMDGGDEEAGIVFAGSEVVALLNAYPYASGHLLVLPRRHVGDLEALRDEESTELWQVVRSAVVALKAAYSPDGLNLGSNLGRAAGAGIPEHLHVHAVPRWGGDTNFMTAIASARVLPEPLDETWQKLRAAWPR